MTSLEDYSEEEINELNAQPWQLQLLTLNSGYLSWESEEKHTYEKWENQFSLDDMNECVAFYFDISRKTKDCECCNAKGYSKEAMPIAQSFYSWCDKITDDEYDTLVQEGRVDYKRGIGNKELLTKEEVNAQNRPGARGLGHDAINRQILVKARLKRLGIERNCEECKGKGSIYIADQAHVSLFMWMLKPRKNTSERVEVTHIEESDLAEVFRFLNKAGQRNAEKFMMVGKYDFMKNLDTNLSEKPDDFSKPKL